jgi:hypothetical protein
VDSISPALRRPFNAELAPFYDDEKGVKQILRKAVHLSWQQLSLETLPLELKPTMGVSQHSHGWTDHAQPDQLYIGFLERSRITMKSASAEPFRARGARETRAT